MQRVALATAGLLALSAGLAFSKPKEQAPAGNFQLIMMTTASNFSGYSSVSRTMAASFTAPKAAPAGATAKMTVPEGMGLVNPIPYTIQNLQGETGGASAEVVHFWNSSPTIPKGQPEILKGQSQAEKTTWKGGSSGYPDPTQMKYVKPNQFMLDETSKVPGSYQVNISYVGDIQVDMTEKQQFLGPLTITSPASSAIDTSAAIEVTWTHVPNALGYTVYASGKDTKGRTCYWENSYHAQTTWYTQGAAAAVKAGKLVSPDNCKVTIPAAIFKGPVTLSVTGYSQEAKGKGPLNPWGWAQSLASMQLGQ